MQRNRYSMSPSNDNEANEVNLGFDDVEHMDDEWISSNVSEWEDEDEEPEWDGDEDENGLFDSYD